MYKDGNMPLLEEKDNDMFTQVAVLPLLFLLQAYPKMETKGIYKTQADFIQHHLEFEAPLSSKKIAIRTHAFSDGPAVTVTMDGQKYYFLKVELFGYRDGNKDYRFFNNETYEIVDTVGFYIYARTGFEKSKGSIQVTKYYFSKTGTDSLQSLTLQNLKSAYPERTGFRYALDAQFSSDRKLLAYDAQLKCYKVKHLFQTEQ